MITPIKQSLSYFSVVSDLHEIAIREDQNDNLQSSMFCNCIAEKIEHCNMPHQKRTCSNDSFTMACGLQLHSMSGNHHDGLRNKCDFILLLDKRTLFSSGNHKLPLECFFSTKDTSAHVMVMKKLAHYVSCYDIDEFTTKEIAQRKMIALHLDETHVQSANIFSNRVIFLPSHNYPKELASSIQVFLLSTLTGKKSFVNLPSRPVHDVEAEFVKNKLFESLDKAKKH